jgi:hypothetical protein
MSEAAWPVASEASMVSGCFVIHSRTRASSASPAATALRISR